MHVNVMGLLKKVGISIAAVFIGFIALGAIALTIEPLPDETVTEPAMESESEPLVTPAIQDLDEPAVEPAMESESEPLVTPAIQDLDEPAVEPVMEPDPKNVSDIPTELSSCLFCTVDTKDYFGARHGSAFGLDSYADERVFDLNKLTLQIGFDRVRQLDKCETAECVDWVFAEIAADVLVIKRLDVECGANLDPTLYDLQTNPNDPLSESEKRKQASAKCRLAIVDEMLADRPLISR